MKKIFASLLAIVLALVQVGSASAKPPAPDGLTYPVCQFSSASGYTGNAPFTVTLTAPDVNSGNYNWHFGDNSPGATEQTVTHTYNGVGRYTISLVVIDNGHHYRGCSTEVNVTLGQVSTPVLPVVPTQIATPTQPTSVAGSGTTSATGSVEGDNNIAPVINGDNNKVIIKIAEPTLVAPVQTTPKSFLWQFVHGLMSPFVSWDTWIVEHH